MTYRGVFHAHSRHSYDGRDPLPELCAALRRRGYDFLLLTEHDDTLDAREYEKIVAECALLSDKTFLIVPGLEVRCWRSEKIQWHIAAVGVASWIARDAIEKVVAAIQAAGGLAILLHPHKYDAAAETGPLEGFDGIEYWNGKEDGHCAPRVKTVRLARDLRARKAKPVLYAGHDLHDVDSIGPFEIELDVATLNRDEVLAALRKGDFCVRTGRLVHRADAGPTTFQAGQLAMFRGFYAAYGALRKLPLIGRALGWARALLKGR